jgi:polyisoprenoid-binding protein YceI
MIKRLLFLLLLFATASASAQNLRMLDESGSVGFVIRNFGIRTNGSFKGLKGNIVFNPAQLASANFNVSIDAATVDTDNSARDKHLRKSDYFDVAKYPLIKFASRSIKNGSKAGEYIVTGLLTIKNITKEIEIIFTASSFGSGYIFKGSFNIDRRDYGVGGKSFSLSDDVKISLNIKAVQ